MRKHYLLATLLALAGAPALIAQDEPVEESHPLTIRDMVAMDRVSSPQISPDGTRVVFVKSSLDLDANRYRSDLWLVNPDGSGLKRLTSNPASDHSPQWDPSGAFIWFLSSRSGSSQVWRIRPDGGEAQAVTSLPVDVENLALAPSGKTLLLSMDVFPDCKDLDCTAKRLGTKPKASGQTFDRLFIRHWDTWEDGRRSHLFAVPAEGGPTVDLMPGMDADCPSRPFGGFEEVAISPDSTTVVFSAKNVGTTEAWSTNFDLFRVPLDGSSAPVNLTSQNLAWDTAPSFSPDGKKLAYLAMARPGFEADRYQIMLLNVATGDRKPVAASWDRSPSSMAWAPDGASLLVSAPNLGQNSLFAIDPSGGGVRTIVKEGNVASPVPSRDQVIFIYDHLQAPAELYSVRWDGSYFRPVTQMNASRLASIRMGEPEQFTFPGWNGETVHAYLVKPVDFDPSRKYPVAFLIHGGPQGSFGNHFHFRWNPQTYAAAGYAALMVDFHGSTGYGQAFTDSISGDWGGKPLEDLQKGLAAALARYSWMDGDRVAALGASYGGYMVNWIAGNWSDRFRCLVSHDGVFDARMAYYATEELWFPEWDQKGIYWDNPEGYERFNPANFVEKWKTPMLIIHGALDYRLTLDQGIAAFTACQRRGIPSRMLYFPDENHWVLKPQNSIQWHEEVLAWIDRWTK